MLSLCYVCPPLAVLMMWRPFGCILVMFAMLGGWKNSQRVALTYYADYKAGKHTGNIIGAVHNPRYTRAKQAQIEAEASLIDDPQVGARGTQFKLKPRNKR